MTKSMQQALLNTTEILVQCPYLNNQVISRCPSYPLFIHLLACTCSVPEDHYQDVCTWYREERGGTSEKCEHKNTIQHWVGEGLGRNRLQIVVNVAGQC